MQLFTYLCSFFFLRADGCLCYRLLLIQQFFFESFLFGHVLCSTYHPVCFAVFVSQNIAPIIDISVITIFPFEPVLYIKNVFIFCIDDFENNILNSWQVVIVHSLKPVVDMFNVLIIRGAVYFPQSFWIPVHLVALKIPIPNTVMSR